MAKYATRKCPQKRSVPWSEGSLKSYYGTNIAKIIAFHSNFHWQAEYEVVWSGMKWYEMKWWCFRPLLCTLFRLNWAMKWYEVAWSGMKWYEVAWSGMKWHEVAWSGMKWYEVVWSGMKWYEVVWSGMKWHEVVWSGTHQWHHNFYFFWPWDSQGHKSKFSQVGKESIYGHGQSWGWYCRKNLCIVILGKGQFNLSWIVIGLWNVLSTKWYPSKCDGRTDERTDNPET